MKAWELARELVKVPSASSREAEVASLLAEVMHGLGFNPIRVGGSLYGTAGNGTRALLLVSHLDTVPVGGSWTKPALEGLVQDDKLYGRGSNDAKGCLAAMVMGVAAVCNENPPDGRVFIAAAREEETTGAGIRELLAALPAFEAAVVGEPTGLRPAVAQKGLMLLTVTSRGRAAHAAWGGGENAVLASAKDALDLSGLTFDRSHPALGLPSLAVTQIRGGTSHNVIPDLCELTLDIRTTPSYDANEILDMIRKRIRGSVSVRSKRYEAVDTDPSHPVVKAALAANPAAEPFGSPTVSDWAFLKGTPAVKVGPGDSRRSHTADEYMTLPEIEAGARFYERLIRFYFGQSQEASQ